MSKRSEIAQDMAEKATRAKGSVNNWLGVLYDLEDAGYQVVKTSETAEYQGLRNAGDSHEN